MADVLDVNEEILEVLQKFERPVHNSVLSGKILCPHENCTPKKEFFEETGVDHHYRVRHKREYSLALKNESARIVKEMHEKETLECLEKIFDYRKKRYRVVLTSWCKTVNTNCKLLIKV